jgi:hypothetical protein
MRRAGLVFVAAAAAVAPLASEVLRLPYGGPNRLVSPDGQWLLYGVPYQQSANDGPELWLENLRTRHKQKLLDIPDTLRAAWFPDSAQFWVEDHTASDQTQTYIFNPATLRRLDLRKAVLSADPSIRPLDDGHRYYNVESAGAQTLLIDFRGHTDTSPVKCFDARYRVTRAGGVSRLSQRIGPCR